MRARLLVSFVLVASVLSVGMMAWAAAIPSYGNSSPSAGDALHTEWIDRTVVVRQTVVVTEVPTIAPTRYPTATRLPLIPTPTGTTQAGPQWASGKMETR